MDIKYMSKKNLSQRLFHKMNEKKSQSKNYARGVCLCVCFAATHFCLHIIRYHLVAVKDFLLPSEKHKKKHT